MGEGIGVLVATINCTTRIVIPIKGGPGNTASGEGTADLDAIAEKAIITEVAIGLVPYYVVDFVADIVGTIDEVVNIGRIEGDAAAIRVTGLITVAPESIVTGYRAAANTRTGGIAAGALGTGIAIVAESTFRDEFKFTVPILAANILHTGGIEGVIAWWGDVVVDALLINTGEGAKAGVGPPDEAVEIVGARTLGVGSTSLTFAVGTLVVDGADAIFAVVVIGSMDTAIDISGITRDTGIIGTGIAIIAD